MRRGAILFALVAAAASAEEPAAPPPAEDAIAAAKRDFAEIKASGASPEQQKLTVPKQALSGFDIRERKERITPPPWLTPNESPGAPADKTGAAASKSENWLLDAMNDQALFPGKDGKKSADGRAATADGSRASGDLLANDRALRSEKDAPAPDGQDTTNGKKPVTDTPNPLVGFMAQWMSPQDYALLKPGITDDQTGLTGGLAGAKADDLTGAFSPQAAADTGGAGANLNDPLAALAPKENPYLVETAPLSNLTASPAGVPGGPASMVPATTPAALPALSAPAQDAAATKVNPAMNAVRQADDDDKYFKQLKRF